MRTCVVYNPATGELTGVLQDHSETVDTSDYPGQAVVILAGRQRANRFSHYVTEGVVTARPVPGCTLDKPTIDDDGIDTATLSGIPTGALVSVTDQNGTTTYTINDGTLEVTADEPGVIDITVTAAFPYQPLTVTVTAS